MKMETEINQQPVKNQNLKKELHEDINEKSHIGSLYQDTFYLFHFLKLFSNNTYSILRNECYLF